MFPQEGSRPENNAVSTVNVEGFWGGGAVRSGCLIPKERSYGKCTTKLVERFIHSLVNHQKPNM